MATRRSCTTRRCPTRSRNWRSRSWSRSRLAAHRSSPPPRNRTARPSSPLSPCGRGSQGVRGTDYGRPTLQKETAGEILMIATGQPVSRSHRLRRRLRHGDVPFRLLAAAFAFIVVALLVAIVGVAWDGSAAAREAFGLGFLTRTAWNPVAGEFGALP